jgi:beta-galactosidase
MLIVLIALSFATTNAAGTREKFDFDWKFHRGDVQGAEAMDFDHSQWRDIDLPHDWSIEDLPGTDSPFDPDAITAVDGGFTTGGIAWYRKEFNIPSKMKNKKFHLQFDGVYMNADFWLNGKHLGHHPYGYTTFSYDITDKLKFDSKNILAVQVKNEGKNSRWYSGSGIYRHVWLTSMDPVHVAHWGTYITTPKVDSSCAEVNIKTKVINETSAPAKVTLTTRILDQKDAEVAKTTTTQTLEPKKPFEFCQDLQVKAPSLWSPESPSLYTAVTEVAKESFFKSALLDKVQTPFGIRTIEFSVEKGFLLNGQPTLLKGGCMHHDNGPLGSAAYDRAEERRVQLMKASGYNSIRCAHNPPSEAFLDACDRHGVLVIDEAFDMWQQQNKPQDYHLYFDQWWQRDIDSMVLRDRNHPSIIMWSTGNEIKEMATPQGIKVSKMLADYVRKLDPTRPVTAAANRLGPDKDPFFATLDIAGYNYSFGGDHGKKSIFELDHARVPDRIMYCSESYPLEAFGAWMDVLEYPYIIGDFVWTSYDYLGEASIGWLGYMQKKTFYPWTHAFCGDIDICGFKRPQSYYRDAIWDNGQKISLFVKPPQPSFKENPKRESWSKWHWHDLVASWNWTEQEDKPLEVTVYSACDSVELFLNGKSLGKKATNRDTKLMATWQVPYEPGTLKAVGFDNSKEVAVSELRTVDKPTNIKLSPDRTKIKADAQDLSYIIVELLDAKGTRNPKAQNLVNFEIQGPGSILATGSSNPMSTESFTLPRRKAYQGRCLVIVKSTKKAGTITLTAKSQGLESTPIKINSTD